MRAVSRWSWRHLALLSRAESSPARHHHERSRCSYHTNFRYATTPTVRRFSVLPATCRSLSSDSTKQQPDSISDLSRDKRELKNVNNYPRIVNKDFSGPQKIYEQYNHIENGAADSAEVLVAGRIDTIRTAGSKLAFIDVREQPGHQKLQIMIGQNHLHEAAGKIMKEYVNSLQRGDVISVRGNPCRTPKGELSIRASELPILLSPCLHLIPDSRFGDDSDWAHEKHVEMLSRPEVINTIMTRSTILQTMQKFLTDRNFIMVQTPILAAAAGGATARPFETAATEFPDRKLAMRIAPELWLKQLIIGGMQKVAEIGPVFRNEGLDKTHNPEFTTCEFYAAYWDLKKLQQQTQAMILDITRAVTLTIPKDDAAPEAITVLEADLTWPEIDFIPALNAALELDLPNLAGPDAREQILQIFRTKNLPLPSKPTLPRLLDKLCSIYLEPRCSNATWIINIPECLSPLAKSFIHPTAPNNQSVAARAELFIQHKEVVNCYEEENSPFEQRRKFIEQQNLGRLSEDGNQISDDEAMRIDEDYLRALEWGLPPTGGWGCGIDRLVMLFTGKDRISDVLSFGNLRQVTRGAERWEKQEDKNGE